MADIRHDLRPGATEIRDRLPDALEVEDCRQRVSGATSPLPVDATSDDDTHVRFWLDPAATPSWDSAPLD